MAVNRGGRGGSQESFSGGSGEGNGNGSGRSTASASDNPYEGHDYEGEWSKENKPKLLDSMRPNPGGTVDYGGNDRFAGDPAGRAKHAHDTKRAAAFDTEMANRAAAKPSTAKPGAPKVKRVPQPTNRTVGKNVPVEMGVKEFGQKLNEVHSILDTHAKSVGSLQLRPEAAEMHNQATDHLDEARTHSDNAAEARRGVVVGNKRYSGDAAAGDHYMKAVSSLRKAHDALGHESVSNTAKLNKLSVELPTTHLEGLEAASKSTRILKGGKPFESIPFGGAEIDPTSIDVKEAEKLMGKDTDAVRKIKAGQRGTRRQDKYKVVAGKEEKMLGGLPGKEDRTRGRGGIVSTPINPKRRASGARSAADRLANADMSRYATPKFEGAPLKSEDK